MQDKNKNAAFVDKMARMGKDHAERLAIELAAIGKEVDAARDDAKKNQLDPVFMSAGRGAYHGALRIGLDNADKAVFTSVSVSSDGEP